MKTTIILEGKLYRFSVEQINVNTSDFSDYFEHLANIASKLQEAEDKITEKYDSKELV